MNRFKKEYYEKLTTPQGALALIESGDYIFCGMAAMEPCEIIASLGCLKTTGVKDVALVNCSSMVEHPEFEDAKLKEIIEYRSWFFGGAQRKAAKMGYLSAIPGHTTSIIRKALDRNKVKGRRNVFMTTVSPMDSEGYFSLSTGALIEWDLAKTADLVIFEVNANAPRTFGDTMIHISEVDALVASQREVPELPNVPFTDVEDRIGKYIAELVADGSTIQLGIGGIPNAVAANLMDKKHLGIHTELFTESMVDLIKNGVVDNTCKGFNDGKSICTFAMGTKKTYEFLHNNKDVEFKSAQYANNPINIGKNKNFVSINSALEIDLYGQCASEAVGYNQFSGTGGQVDTVVGSQLSPGGKSIMAIPSSFMAKVPGSEERILKSKIVAQLQPGTVVTTSRNDIDYVVTEYGIAWLRGASVKERVLELVEIAHPDFRDKLMKEAKEFGLYPR